MIELEAIRSVPRFAGISQAGHEWIATHLTRGSYQRGGTIFFEGDPCTHLHLVEDGMVKVFKTLESGRELILDIFRSGESFGEVAVIDDVDHPATAIALEPTSILFMSRGDYVTLLEQYPESALAVIRDLTLRMRSMRRRVEQLGEGGVESRLAQVLAAFARRMGELNGKAILIPIQITRQELADMVGARIETVIRIMSRWHREEHVDTIAEGFLVAGSDVLERLSQTSR